MRREFTRAQKAAIVHRAMNAAGQICCEGCCLVLGKKPHEIDHTIPEALIVDKTRPLTIADGELRDAIKRTLVHDLAPMGVEVTDFQLTDLQYTKSFRDAVNNAAVQKAGIETVEYQRQQAEKVALTAKVQAIGQADAAREAARGQADAVVLNAKAAAESRLLQATAEAKAIQLQGEATAAAILAQSDALKANAMLVEMEKAKRWNGALPTSIYAGAPIPFMSAK